MTNVWCAVPAARIHAASVHQCSYGVEEETQVVLSLVDGRDILVDVEQRVDRDLCRADRIFDCEDDVVGDLAILANKGDVGRARRLDGADRL